MNPQLEKYVNNRARSLSRTFPTLDVGDLVNEAWSIYLKENDDGIAFNKIRKRFNAVKMQVVREARRYVPLERVDNTLKVSYNPEDMMIARLDLRRDIEELSSGTTKWRTRVLRKKVRRYLRGDRYNGELS